MPLAIEVDVLRSQIGPQAHQSAYGECHIEQRPKRMRPESDVHLAVNRRRKARSQPTTRTWPPGNEHAGAWRKPQLAVGAVAVLIRREKRARARDENPRQKPDQIDRDCSAVWSRRKLNHVAPRSESRIPAEDRRPQLGRRQKRRPKNLTAPPIGLPASRQSGRGAPAEYPLPDARPR